MVIEDLSFKKPIQNLQMKNNRPMIQDRFFSFVFDFLFLSPIIMFLIFPLIKKIKLNLMLGGLEIYSQIYIFIAICLVLVFIFVYQVMCLYYYGSSFGQKIFQLHVQSNSRSQNFQSNKIFLYQAMQYSSGYIFSFFLLGIPFLSVITHRFGHTFYERLAELEVVTAKKNRSMSLSEFEIQFFKQWTRLIIVFSITLVSIILIQHTFVKLKSADMIKSKVDQVCANSDWNQFDHQSRLETYFSKYLAEQSQKACVEHLLEGHFWYGVGLKNKSFLYVTKYFMTNDPEIQDEYFKYICADKKSEDCVFMTAYQKDQLHQLSFSTEPKWLLVLTVEELIRLKKYSQAFQFLQKFYGQTEFQRFYAHALAQTYYGTSQISQARLPASQGEQEIETQFKKYFGVQ